MCRCSGVSDAFFAEHLYAQMAILHILLKDYLDLGFTKKCGFFLGFWEENNNFLAY